MSNQSRPGDVRLGLGLTLQEDLKQDLVEWIGSVTLTRELGLGRVRVR